MTPNKQVSPVIRISRGERDASARATHLEAATRKFLVTTNERKQMSTKTNFKRIALVAVAALGLGVLSSVPSQAAISGLTVTVANGTAGAVGARTDSTNAATINLSGFIGANDSVTVYVVSKSIPSTAVVTPVLYNLDSATPRLSTQRVDSMSAGTTAGGVFLVSGSIANSIRYTDTVIATYSATVGGARLTSSADANINHTFGLQLDTGLSTTRSAGTYTYSVVVKTFEAGANLTGAATSTTTKDVSIVIAATTDVSLVPSAVTSFARLTSAGLAAGAASSASSDSVISALSTAGTTAGYIFVGNRNAADGNATAQDSLTATVTGAGLVCTSVTGVGAAVGSTCGKSIKVSASAGDYQFALQSDGTGGASSVTVTSSVAGWVSTKTLTYYLAAAKTITATVAIPALRVGTNAGAVRVVPVDANGSNWTGTPYIVASAAADALVGGSATTPVACTAFSATLGYATCDISTLTTGTAKFKVIDAATVALATATSNEVTVTVTNAVPASVKISFDKATYAPNERARIYVTPLDSAGKEMQSVTADLLAAGGITVNGGISFTGSTTTADSLTATSITTSATSSSTSGAKAGSMVYTVYMPAAGGSVTISATGGTGLPVSARVAVTASATVSDSGAAALAAVTALATTVASLKTLITTLTNLVLKIQKKVKA
jgi:trimeric autotransporter adhesin